MTPKVAAFAGAIAIVVGLGLAAAILQASESRAAGPGQVERLLYVQSAKTLQRLSLGFDALIADLYWIRTIQHFGADRKSSRTTGRFELLYPLLDLTTTLDPHFNIAYRYGAILLALERPEGPGRPDQAIGLLEKGLTSNPDRWQYAYDIGFIHYFYTFDYAAAGRWFDRASRMPRAPEWILPLAATTTARGGDRKSARDMLMRLQESDAAYIRRAAERGLLQLRALDEIDQLQALVDTYAADHVAQPESWIDLMNAGVLSGVPADPLQVPYVYGPATHRVSLSPQSPLAPLPVGLGRQ
ncbi:MAG TPA: tetratricopeptide repeat protein [Vicinamibacterales bacterium]|nr:tetratricopeptide repeat protein [Vicinamibacterales bacterium]